MKLRWYEVWIARMRYEHDSDLLTIPPHRNYTVINMKDYEHGVSRGLEMAEVGLSMTRSDYIAWHVNAFGKMPKGVQV